MKKLIGRIQKDLQKLQNTITKESTDFIKKVKKVDLKSNLDSARQELAKLLNTKMQKIEPSYQLFMDQLHKNAKKAGIDLGKIETELKRRASQAQDKLKKTTAKTSKTILKKGKAGTTKKATASTTTAKKASKSPRRKTKTSAS